jgi:glutamate-1-semialdehyde 2,1-aminomutase
MQAGTYNGNALSMAAARANLLEVLTPGAYERLEELGERMVAGCTEALAAHGLPGYALALGARGCVTLSPIRIVDHRTFTAGVDTAVSRLMWLWGMNRGLFLAPGRPELWTLSVAHTADHVDAYIARFAELSALLARTSARRRDDGAADHLAAA